MSEAVRESPREAHKATLVHLEARGGIKDFLLDDSSEY